MDRSDLLQRMVRIWIGANLDSLYYLMPSERKMDAIKIDRFTKDELTIIWPMGTATPDSVVLHFC